MRIPHITYNIPKWVLYTYEFLSSLQFTIHFGFLRTIMTESPRRNILLMNLSLLTGWAFFLPLPVFGTSVHISLTFSKTMLQCLSNALTRPRSFLLFLQFIRTCVLFFTLIMRTERGPVLNSSSSVFSGISSSIGLLILNDGLESQQNLAARDPPSPPPPRQIPEKRRASGSEIRLLSHENVYNFLFKNYFSLSNGRRPYGRVLFYSRHSLINKFSTMVKVWKPVGRF